MARKSNPSRPYYASVIAKVRTDKNLTQTQLGELIGRKGYTVKSYEMGKRIPSVKTLYRILAVTDNFNSIDLLIDILNHPDGGRLFINPVISDMKDIIDGRKLSLKQKIYIVAGLAEREFLYWEDYKFKIGKYKKMIVENAIVRGE